MKDGGRLWWLREGVVGVRVGDRRRYVLYPAAG